VGNVGIRSARHLLIGLVLALSGSVIGLLAYQALFVQAATWREASFLVQANALADHVLGAALHHARERGAMHSALAARTSGRPWDPELEAFIAAARQDGDAQLERALEQAGELAARGFGGPWFGERLQRTQGAWAELVRARARADRALRGAGGAPAAREWLQAATALIEAAADLRMAAFWPPEGHRSAAAYNLEVKHALWLAAEYAGRERALWGAVIAAGAPLPAAVGAELHGYRAITELHLDFVRRILSPPLTRARPPEMAAAYQEALEQVNRIFLGRFEATRQALSAGAETGLYPMTPEGWLQESTAAIDTLLALNDVVTADVRRYADAVQASSARTALLSSALLVVGVLASVLAVLGVREVTRRVGQAQEALRAARDELDLRVQQRTAQLERANASLHEENAERLRLERALRESYADLNRAQAVAQTGSWRLDLRRNHLRWSDEAYRIFGVPPDTPVTYEDFLACVHPDDRERVNGEWTAALRGAPYDVEHRILVAGEVKWVRERAELEFDGQGSLLGGIGTVQDITERKHIEEALQRTSEEIRDLYNNAPCGYHSLDSAGTVVRINATELHWLGYSREEVVGKLKFSDLLTPASLQCFRHEFARLKQTGSRRDLEVELIRKDGSTFPVLVSASAIHDAEGKYLMSRSTVFDHTERRRLEAQLREQAHELQKVDERKDRFLATLSHELRNPLATIRNTVELLRRGALDDRAALERARGVIDRQARHIASLVNDLLDVSRIARGKVALRRAPIDLGAVLSQALEASGPAFESGGHAVCVELPETPVRLEGDFVRLAQVFANLLGNAAKYTPPGGRIHMCVEAGAEEVVVRVRDTGVGIAAEMLPHIFEPFAQADAGSVRSQGGLGIGLALVRSLVQLHGGSVGALSDGVGCGSEFFVRLPALTRGLEAPLGECVDGRPAVPPILG
jgi:PAS domain S-box-containing protein